MHRRELLKLIAAATGCALVGARDAPAAPATPARPPFNARELAMLDEIAETILPRTGTPGARDAAVGAFIARYAAACYEAAQLRTLRQGIARIDAETRQRTGTGFLRAKPAQRHALLLDLDRQARAHARQPGQQEAHYFTLMKQLAMLGYFTSKPGSTRMLRYRPVPGKYRGRVPYKKGETSWA